MKRLFCVLTALLAMMPGVMAQVDKVDPPFWWAGMHNPELQVMLYGKGIGEYRPSISAKDVQLLEIATFENPDYLVLYLNTEDAAPGTFDITLTKGKSTIKVPYELKARRDESDIKGYDKSDVLYLIMPDRFANGDPGNDNIQLTQQATVDRSRHMARHGGDLKGISDHLGYIDSLGVTAIWLNPVLVNDARGGSYHGYFATDLYRIDPRLGTNDEYIALIDKAHSMGLKVVMDMIFNHIGGRHPWVLNPPASDWINHSPERGNHAKLSYIDPYASEYDSEVMRKSGFHVDINQKNRHIAKYLIQNSIWWIENSRIDAIRQDTYPYADYAMMRRWNEEVLAEYPQFNIVGEVWDETPIATSWWQRGSVLPHKEGDSGLKSVMDFTLMSIASDVFNDTTSNEGRLRRVYEHLATDIVYPDIDNLLRFLDNHDTDRFLREAPDNLDGYKQALTFLLTIPGTPQIYYGTEMLMNGSKNRPGGDGNVRLDVPGGWEGDEANWFTREGRSDMQNEAFDFLSKLLHWRRGNKVVTDGMMKQYLPFQGVYVYERTLGDRSVIVFMNGAKHEVNLPLVRYAESIRGRSQAKDVVTDQVLTLSDTLTLAPKQVIIAEIGQ